MDLMEQIRLEAEKYADIEYDRLSGTYVNSAWAGVRDHFQAGAQALLNLLGRSATSEGHPPRVWLHGSHWWLEPREGNREYLSIEEHQSLRAADLLEIARLRERLEIDHAYDLEGNKVAAPDESWDGIACRDTTIRLLKRELEEYGERNAKLTAALEKIAAPLPDNEIPDPHDDDEEVSEKWRAAARKRRELAKEALGEAGK